MIAGALRMRAVCCRADRLAILHFTRCVTFTTVCPKTAQGVHTQPQSGQFGRAALVARRRRKLTSAELRYLRGAAREPGEAGGKGATREPGEAGGKGPGQCFYILKLLTGNRYSPNNPSGRKV